MYQQRNNDDKVLSVDGQILAQTRGKTSELHVFGLCSEQSLNESLYLPPKSLSYSQLDP